MNYIVGYAGYEIYISIHLLLKVVAFPHMATLSRAFGMSRDKIIKREVTEP